MASVIPSATSVAHTAAVTASQALPAKVGGSLPAVKVKELDPTSSFSLPTKGKIVIVGVPGAFTPTCSSQVPGYISHYDDFAAKGVKEIFVLSVSDTFVMQAWQKKLAEQGTKVRFIADDTGAYATALGLIFDATPLLGAPRAKRFALVAEDNVIKTLEVEEDPGVSTITAAESLLAKL